MGIGMKDRRNVIKDEYPYSALHLISLASLMKGDFIKTIKFLAKDKNKRLFRIFFYKLRDGEASHRLFPEEQEIRYREYYNLLRQLISSQSNTSNLLQKYSEMIHEEFINYIVKECELRADKMTIIGGFISFFPLLLSILLSMNKVTFNITFLLAILIVYNLLLLFAIKIIFSEPYENKKDI